MAVTGVGSSNNNVYGSTYASQKNEVSNKAETKETTGAQTENTHNSTGSKVSDYYSYLQKNYDCMSKGNVTISGKYLEKCAGNAQKAKELEDFLKRVPEIEEEGYKNLSAHIKALGGTVTYYQETFSVDKDGRITGIVYSVTEKGMTNAERMKKDMDERLEKQKEKKEEEEKLKQEEKLSDDTEKVPSPEEKGLDITIKYVEAGSEQEAKAMMQKEKLEDVYYPKFDAGI